MKSKQGSRKPPVSINITGTQKSKLVSMIYDLYPEYQSVTIDINLNVVAYDHITGEVGGRKAIIHINWFQFVITELVDKILCQPISNYLGVPVFARDLQVDLSKMYKTLLEYYWNEKDYIKSEAEHPIDYLYNAYKTKLIK